MSSYFTGMTDSTRRTGASRYVTWVSAETSADAAQASSGVPNAAACSVSVPDATTRQNASRRAGIIAAASLIIARTGVMPGVPIISALVINAPTQCDTSISSWPETPGKKYLLPPEKPTTSCGNTGPTTSATSASATCRLILTSTAVSVSRPSVSSPSRSAEMVPSVVNVPGTQDSWFRIRHPG